ncbi:thioredoxin domain-containing protein [Actinoplanes sp. NPDC026670]|uniref:DsbA family protein n=1 Tax=Actinoplanes sp. NPDC026670 TaxID=3154700 RepID=UPI0033CE1B3D
MATARRAAKTTAPPARYRPAVIAGGLIIIVLLVAIVVVIVRAAGEPAAAPVTTPSGGVVAPAVATTAGAVAVGDTAAPVRVEVFLDYMCPFCGRFDRANSSELRRLVQDRTVRLEVYPLAFLDDMSQNTQYSSRAANAAATVADRAPDRFLAFSEALFADQPAEGTKGLADEQIADRARTAGVPEQVVAVFTDRLFAAWVARSTATVLDGQIEGTPTVRIDGTRFDGDLYTAGPLTQAVIAAKG